MRKWLSKAFLFKCAVVLIGGIVAFLLFRGIMLFPRFYEPGQTVQFHEGNLKPWSTHFRYLRRLVGLYADTFVLSGAEDLQFHEDYVEFTSKGHSTYIDIPLVRRIDADEIQGVRVVMSFSPELQEDERFLQEIGRYYSRVGMALGDDFEYTLNLPLQPGEETEEYEFFLSGFSEWRDEVDSLRLIPALGPGRVRIQEITFLDEIAMEELELETAMIDGEEFYLAYLSDMRRTDEGVVPLENQLQLSFLETPDLPAEQMNSLSLEVDYSYEQPTPYLLFFDGTGEIVDYFPLQKEEDELLLKEEEVQGDFEYLGIYLPPDATDKLVEELYLQYEEATYHIELIPLHNNALMGDRDNFAIFLTREEEVPVFVPDSYMKIRYIEEEYPREELTDARIQVHDVSDNTPRMKTSWEKDDLQWLLPFEHTVQEIFLGKHPEYQGSFSHMEFVLENFHGPVDIKEITLQEGEGDKLEFNELAAEIFEQGLMFDNHGDCNDFRVKENAYTVSARLEKGRVWSHQFPLVTQKMEELRIQYRMKGEPLTVRCVLQGGEYEETSVHIQTYNQPHRLDVSFPELEEPLQAFRLISPLEVNWGKMENVKISGVNVDGEEHEAVLKGPDRTMPSEDLSDYRWNEIARGEYLLLEDMHLIRGIDISFEYTYTPDNRPYFYWFGEGEGREVHYLDGIRADGEVDEIRVPLAAINEEILPVWGLSLFWCPGTLEIKEVEVKMHD